MALLGGFSRWPSHLWSSVVELFFLLKRRYVLGHLSQIEFRACEQQFKSVLYFLQTTPLVAGLSIAVAAMAGKYGIEAYQAFKLRPAVPRMRKFYEGGFQPTMTRREAALILGVR
jgi:hypothetical protein